MEVYIVIVFAIVCTISQFSQIVIADLVPVHVKEFVEFCGNNGHKYLTIFDDGNSAKYKKIKTQFTYSATNRSGRFSRNLSKLYVGFLHFIPTNSYQKIFLYEV